MKNKYFTGEINFYQIKDYETLEKEFDLLCRTDKEQKETTPDIINSFYVSIKRNSEDIEVMCPSLKERLEDRMKLRDGQLEILKELLSDGNFYAARIDCMDNDIKTFNTDVYYEMIETILMIERLYNNKLITIFAFAHEDEINQPIHFHMFALIPNKYIEQGGQNYEK